MDPAGVLRSFLLNFPTSDHVSDPLVLIPTFENSAFLKNILLQLTVRNIHRFFILDGGSKDPDMARVLKPYLGRGQAFILQTNPGPHYFYQDEDFFSELPGVFCVTDPDLQLNSSLPANFLSILFSLTHEFMLGKAGFALEIGPGISEDTFFIRDRFFRIQDWEKQFWLQRLQSVSSDEVYSAFIDTTFALYNKEYFETNNFFRAVRVGGSFSAIHIPWYPEIAKAFPLNSRSVSQHFGKEMDKERINAAFLKKEEELRRIQQSASWRMTAPLRIISALLRSIQRKR